jgi:hypothetical protein
MNAFTRPAKHVFVPLDEIDISHAIRPYNSTVVGELAQSIRAIGLQTALTCIVRDGQHILVSGRNRLEALRVVGAEQAPVRIVDFTEIEAQLWQLSENLHRAELTKLQYDQQVVRYAELFMAKQAEEAVAHIPPQPANEIPPEGVSRQVGAKPPHQENVKLEGETSEADKLRQLGAVSGGRGNTGGHREAARDLNIPEQTVRRAYQTASLSPQAQKAAIETGLDEQSVRAP